MGNKTRFIRIYGGKVQTEVIIGVVEVVEVSEIKLSCRLDFYFCTSVFQCFQKNPKNFILHPF